MPTSSFRRDLVISLQKAIGLYELDAVVSQYKMLHFWLSVLLLMANAKTVDSPGGIACQWACEKTCPPSLKEGSPKEAQFGTRFRLNKLVDQNCANNRAVNSSTFGKVWILLASDDSNLSDHEFSFSYFTAMFFSENMLVLDLLQFLLESYESYNDSCNVSCVLRPTSNESTRAAVSGLDVVYSPLWYMYIENNGSFIENIPFIGYVYVEGHFYFSAGFTNAELEPKHSLKFEHAYAVTILSYFISIVFSLYSAYMLTLFCSNIITVRVEHLPPPTQESANVPTEQEELNETIALDQNSSRVPTEQDEDIDDLGQVDDSYQPVQTDRASRSDVAGVAYQVVSLHVENEQVIDVGGQASPVGFRSLIANKVFSNSSSLDPLCFNTFCLSFARFVILITFPIFIPMWIDFFVLVILRRFSKIYTSTPPPFLTDSIISSASKPGLLVCFLCYIFRSFCFCFLQSSSTWVPSFLCRKHLKCFIYNNYLFQLLFPNNSLSVCCDQCKKTPNCPKQCQIPVNIQHNHSCSVINIFTKNWVDVYEDMYPRYKQWLLQRNDGCQGRKFKIFKILGMLGLGMLYVGLIVLDFIVSLPITSLCYGRVWFTINWSENKCIQALFLIVEFLVICFSIAWLAYFSYSCAFSMEIALKSFFLSGLKYPVETILFSAIIILVHWHILWGSYSSFTNTYDDLLLKLFKVCCKNHSSELRQYNERGIQYIPKKLFDYACDKLLPVKSRLVKLCKHLGSWAFFLFCIFLFVLVASETGGFKSVSEVLTAGVTFLIAIIPIILDFLSTRCKKKERKDEVLKENVKNHVDAYFKDKLA